MTSIWKGKVFAGDSALDEDNEVFKIIASELDTRSITPPPFYSMNLQGNNLGEVQAEKGFISARQSDLEARKEEFVSLQQDALEKLKKGAKGVTSDGKFTPAEKALMGIAESFDQKITKLEEYLRELEEFETLVSTTAKDIALTFVETYKLPNSEKEVKRFGINTPNMKQDISDNLAEIYTKTDKTSSVSVSTVGTAKKKVDTPIHMLHPLEVLLIKEAIKSASESGLAVIVDIFERDVSGKISREGHGAPKTHAIMLCVQDNVVKIVDPSNSEFSRHVSYNGDIIFSNIDEMEMLVPAHQVKIYSPLSGISTGPAPDQPRDCINIAVLMADSINTSGINVDINDLFSIEAIRFITNQKLPKQHKQEDGLFFYAYKTPLVVRMEQASDKSIRDKIHKLTFHIKEQINTAKGLSSTG